MEKRRSRLRWFGVLVMVAIISIFSIQIQGAEKPTNEIVQARPDVITIAPLKGFENLEQPLVLFLHDLHTDALEKKKKDCTTCHLSEKDRLTYKFKRLKDIGGQAEMNLYHDNCIGCHTKMTAAKEKTGPVVCGECHKKKTTFLSSRVPIGFDKSLHYRHSKAQANKCERCHHQYDKKDKKLYYAKGQEGTCRYCHKKRAEIEGTEKVLSMKLASHLACVGCHQKTEAKHMDAGPVKCGGCHSVQEQKAIEKVTPVPRMKMGQPDVALIKTGDRKGREPTMMRVPFTHKAHEKYNDTCRVCHHANLKSCVSCHPLTYSENSQNVDLKTAFHLMGNNSSCIGCHKSKQHDKDCAGCHAFMQQDRQKEASPCLRCHMTPLPKRTGRLSTSKAAKMARLMPKIWRETFGTYKVDVPKKVIIQKLVDRYEPVEFPHRKIFNALVKRINNSKNSGKLAQYFHSEKTTLCLGCHHNTPVSGRPPACSNCHGKPFDKNDLFKPGIKGSFHRQCIGCHQKMGIEKYTSCTACHKERKKEVMANPLKK